MNKLKLYTSLVILILCVGIVGVGVYAAIPTKNSVYGSITFSASNLVELSGYIGDSSSADFSSETLNGVTWNLSSPVELNLQGVNKYDSAPPAELKIAIKNKSTKNLGAYFYNGIGQKPNQASEDDIKVEDVLGNGIVTVNFDSYTKIEPGETQILKITFNLERKVMEELSLNFNFALNIEEYQEF